jgi:hypothetical protein
MIAMQCAKAFVELAQVPFPVLLDEDGPPHTPVNTAW